MGIDRLRTPGANKVLAHDDEMVTLERRKLKCQRDSDDVVLKCSDDDAEICAGPTCFDLCDDILLFSLFRNAAVFHEKGYGYGKPEEIQVKILVSVSLAVCYLH
jgi:hypothetical protein